MKMTILPKAIYGVNVIIIKIPMQFFNEMGKTILKMPQISQLSKAILNEDTAGSIPISALQVILQVPSSKSRMILAKKKKIDEWNKIKNTDISKGC